MKQVISAAVFCLGALLATAAAAVEYKALQPDGSSIGFGYQQMGVKMDGRFARFTAQLAFDPAKPTSGKAVIDVDLASIDTGLADVDKEVAGKQWFDVKAHPTARFVSTSVKDLGGNRYEVAGKLTIKGRTQDVVAPVIFSVQGNRGVFDGSFAFRRADFAIGEGPWAKFDAVANEIEVKFRILAVATAGR